jgi:hypothetical protein
MHVADKGLRTLDNHPQHTVPAMELPQEHLIRAGQREIPDQLRAGDLTETPQPRQLLRREHVPRRHLDHLAIGQPGTRLRAR